MESGGARVAGVQWGTKDEDRLPLLRIEITAKSAAVSLLIDYTDIV